MRRLTGAAALALQRGAQRGGAKAFSLLVAGGFAEFGPHSVIERPVRLKHAGRIAIGAGVYVGAGSWLQVLDADGGGVAIEIGDGTSIAGSCVLSAVQSVRLGDRVLLARNVYIADHGHAYSDTTRAVLDQGVEGVASVEIGDGAWLGQNVVVCPGVRIGRGAVVGANAVVREDVPDYGLAVGVPARVVRRFDRDATPAR